MNITEAALTESASLRENYTDTSVLDRVGVVPSLPDDIHLTTEMVATFYQVDKDVIQKTVQRNRDELERNGLRVLRGDDLKRFKEELAGHEGGQDVHLSRSNQTLLTRRTLLNVGMLLRDSEVAKQVRTYLLEVEESASSEQKDAAVNATLARLEEKIDELSENLGDYNSIETEANGLNMSVVADMLGVTLVDLRSYLVRENWVYQPYHYSNQYLPTDWGINADLVEFAPKKSKSSARITANGRRVLRKNFGK